MFHDREDKDTVSLVRNKSYYTPEKSNDEYLEQYITNITNKENFSAKPSNVKHNISLKESKAIKALKNNPDIIIKEADKGGATVIMNKDFYKNKIDEMLSDTCYYEKLECDPYHQTKQEYSKLITNDKQWTYGERKRISLQIRKKRKQLLWFTKSSTSQKS